MIIWGYLQTILTFFVALGILVLVHEWGHYIVAKLSGVWVEKFSIGFGPKILGFTKNGTDYRVAPLPLGGYVKLYGQDPLEEAEGDEQKAEEIARDPRSFHSKPLRSKLATVLAGPFMNFVLCLLIMPLVFMIGRMQPKIFNEKPVLLDVVEDSPADQAGLEKGDLILAVNGIETPTWQALGTQIALHPEQEVEMELVRDGTRQSVRVQSIRDPDSKQPIGFMGIEPMNFYANEPVVDKVNPGSPADKAGLKPGDRIVRIGDREIKYWNAMTKLIQKAEGRPLDVTVLRGGGEQRLSLAPVFNEELNTWILGIQMRLDESLFQKKSYGFTESVAKGFKENVRLFGLTADILKRLFTGNLSVKYLGGPIQIAQATSTAAKNGLAEFIYLVAFLSLQLGILNLLPIPVLDGGHVLFMAIEGIRRKPISPRIRQVSTQIGLAMLLGLMVVVTFNDFNTLFNVSGLFESIKGMF